MNRIFISLPDLNRILGNFKCLNGLKLHTSIKDNIIEESSELTVDEKGSVSVLPHKPGTAPYVLEESDLNSPKNVVNFSEEKNRVLGSLLATIIDNKKPLTPEVVKSAKKVLQDNNIKLTLEAICRFIDRVINFSKEKPSETKAAQDLFNFLFDQFFEGIKCDLEYDAHKLFVDSIEEARKSDPNYGKDVFSSEANSLLELLGSSEKLSTETVQDARRILIDSQILYKLSYKPALKLIEKLAKHVLENPGDESSVKFIIDQILNIPELTNNIDTEYCTGFIPELFKLRNSVESLIDFNVIRGHVARKFGFDPEELAIFSKQKEFDVDDYQSPIPEIDEDSVEIEEEYETNDLILNTFSDLLGKSKTYNSSIREERDATIAESFINNNLFPEGSFLYKICEKIKDGYPENNESFLPQI